MVGKLVGLPVSLSHCTVTWSVNHQGWGKIFFAWWTAPRWQCGLWGGLSNGTVLAMSRRIQHACLTNIHSSIITQTLIQKHSYFLDYIIVICPGLWIGCVTRHTHCDVIWWVNEMCYMSHPVTIMWHVWWIRCVTLILGHCHVTLMVESDVMPVIWSHFNVGWCIRCGIHHIESQKWNGWWSRCFAHHIE